MSTTPTPTRVRALDPLAQDLAQAMVEVLRRYAGEGRLPEELQKRLANSVSQSGATSAAEPQPRADSALPAKPVDRSKLTDRFQILGPTGGDAFGESFLGRDTASGNNVMIRLLHKQLASDPAFMHSFDEACKSMIAMPRHPHVVEVLSHGVHFGQPYVVSESIRGRSLADIISIGERLPEIDVLRMAEQVASALMHVKANTGLNHGELRPQALLVAYSGIAGIKATNEVESVKVGDFIGPRLPWHDPARLPPLSCTFYVAPEQFSPDGVVDARTDMYSLGAIMFHLLTGKPPYAGTNEEVRTGHLGLRVADPGDHVTGLSDATRQVVTTCLATSRNDRFINVQGFIAAITKALQMHDGLRSMRFLRKPMRRVPTPRPADRPATEAVARQADKPAAPPKPATSRLDKEPTAKTVRRPQFPTPLPQEMPVVDEFEGRDRMEVVSERIMRKHREKKGGAEEPPATTTALIRRGSAEEAAARKAKEAAEAKDEPAKPGAEVRVGDGHPQETPTASARRRLGSAGRPHPHKPQVIPPPESRPLELWAYRLAFAAILGAAVAYAYGWRPF